MYEGLIQTAKVSKNLDYPAQPLWPEVPHAIWWDKQQITKEEGRCQENKLHTCPMTTQTSVN